MSPRNVVSLSGDTAAFPCSLVEFGKLLEDTRRAFPAASIFLPLACLLIFGWFWFNDAFRLSRLELRRWRLIHHYFKHFHDWSEEEEAIGVSEMYTHCRPADFRYPAYPEEMHTKQANGKATTGKRTDEFVRLSKGYLHVGWEEIWYEKKGTLRTTKWMIYGMSLLLICQTVLLLFCYILRLNDPLLPGFYQNLTYQLEKREINNVFCSRKLEEKDFLQRISHLIFLSVLKENGLHKGKWVEMGIILLFAVFFALHLALTARNLVPPSLPQPLLSTTISSQKDYALIAKHRSAILFYVVYLAVLTLLFSAFTSYAMLQQYLHKK